MCRNHIVWDATEVVEFSRKHTASVHESLAEMRRIVEQLVTKRDARKDGFVSVINLQLASEAGANVEEEGRAAQAAGLKYIHLPFDAAMPDPKVVEAFLTAVATTANQPAFIHCGSANRVGGMWMIKRVLQDGWTIDRARTEAQAIGLRDPQLDAFAVKFINEHKR